MPRWASQIEIAGQSFTGCRAEIVDGESFASPFRGSVEWANSGQADFQTVNVGVKGNAFGLQMLSNEIIDVKSCLTAINAAINNNELFRVIVVDEMYSIHVMCSVDWNANPWFKHGRPAEGWVENVLFRFVSKEEAV